MSKRSVVLAFVAAAAGLFLAGSAEASIVTSSGLTLLTTGPASAPTPVLSGPADIALSSNGATAYANNVLAGFAAHSIAHLNDGTYGNSNSWISGSDTPVHDPTGTTLLGEGFAGIALPVTALDPSGQYQLTEFAFGRNNDAVDSPKYADRTAGVYYVQYTTAANPSASTPDSAYTTIGSITNSGDSTAGDALRHLYQINTPVDATGLRITVQNTFADNANNAQDIDEIEIIGSPIPEPASLSLLGLGTVGLLARRRS